MPLGKNIANLKTGYTAKTATDTCLAKTATTTTKRASHQHQRQKTCANECLRKNQTVHETRANCGQWTLKTACL